MAILKISEKLSTEKLEKLTELIGAIPEVLSATENSEYDEIYGYRIAPEGEEHVDEAVRNKILYKFLVASGFDVEAAKKKLTNSLNWRRKFQVLNAAFGERYDADLEKMGVITEYPDNSDNFRVVTWNLYANLKNPKKLFAKFGVGVDSDNTKGELLGTMFLRWRVGLMERSLGLLDFTDLDNNKIAQVHDYNNVSMFRIDPGMKAATKEIITVFSDNYPELLSKKYFINVPLIMGWVFTFFKATGLMSAETLKKFEMQNHGNLSDSFGKDNLPKDYNGGVENPDVATIFISEVTFDQIKIPEYGQVIIDKFFKKSGEEAIANEAETSGEKLLREEAKSID